MRRAAAATTAGVLVGLVACDVSVAGVRAWWDRHSFTSCVVSSLLVLGVTVLIIDEVLARRQRRERTGSVAVQALIVYGQARRSCDAVVAMAVAGTCGGGADKGRADKGGADKGGAGGGGADKGGADKGGAGGGGAGGGGAGGGGAGGGGAGGGGAGGDGAGGGGAEHDVAQVDVRDEVRSLANMILVASPALFDDPEARLFLEEVQRLAGTMYALWPCTRSYPPRPGGRRRHRRRLEGGQVENRRPRRPAGGPVGGQGQGPARRPRQPGRSTARNDRGPGPRRLNET